MTFYEFFHSITSDQFGAIILFLIIAGWVVESIVDTLTKNRKR